MKDQRPNPETDQAGDAEGRDGKNKARSSAPSMWNLAGMGIDLSAAVAGFTLIGWWADRHWETSPRYTVVGAVLGLIGGMYNLIRRAIKATHNMNSNRNERDGHDS